MSRFSTKWLVLVVVGALMLATFPAGVQAAGATAIAYGDSVTGQLDNKTYYQLYQFDGTRGDHVLITMTGDGALDTYLGLIDGATEEVLIEDDDSAGNSNAQIQYDLTSTGTFIIVATRYGLDTGTSSGSYTLQLEGGAGPSGTTSTISNQQSNNTGVSEPQMIDEGIYLMGSIAVDEQVEGQITTDMYAQLYTIDAAAGEEIIVGMFATDTNLDPYLMVLDSEGTVQAQDEDSGAGIEGAGQYDAALSIAFPSAGTYYIAATRSGVQNGKSTGGYVLMVVVPEGQGQNTSTNQQQNTSSNNGIELVGEMAVGDTANGTITNETYIQLFNFIGTANEQVTITATAVDGLDTYIGIMDPNEQIIAEDDDSGGGANGTDAQLSIRLPETGLYTIIVTRAGIETGTTTGDYTVTLTAGTPQPAEGQSGLGGFGGLPARAVPGEEGTTFYLRGFGTTDDPSKATPLQQLLAPQPMQLPGR